MSSPTISTSSPAMPRPSPGWQAPAHVSASSVATPHRTVPGARRRAGHRVAVVDGLPAGVVHGQRRQPLHHRTGGHRNDVDAPADRRGATRDQLLGGDETVGQHHDLRGARVDEAAQQLLGGATGSVASASGRRTWAPSPANSSAAPSPSTTASTARSRVQPPGACAAPPASEVIWIRLGVPTAARPRWRRPRRRSARAPNSCHRRRPTPRWRPNRRARRAARRRCSTPSGVAAAQQVHHLELRTGAATVVPTSGGGGQILLAGGA